MLKKYSQRTKVKGEEDGSKEEETESKKPWQTEKNPLVLESKSAKKT